MDTSMNNDILISGLADDFPVSATGLSIFAVIYAFELRNAWEIDVIWAYHSDGLFWIVRILTTKKKFFF